MAIENANSFILPSNPEDRKKILELFKELSASYARIEGERTFIKEAIDVAAENHQIPKKVLRAAAKIYHKQNFDGVTVEAEQLTDFYEQIVGLKS